MGCSQARGLGRGTLAVLDLVLENALPHGLCCEVNVRLLESFNSLKVTSVTLTGYFMKNNFSKTTAP